MWITLLFGCHIFFLSVMLVILVVFVILYVFDCHIWLVIIFCWGYWGYQLFLDARISPLRYVGDVGDIGDITFFTTISPPQLCLIWKADAKLFCLDSSRRHFH